MKHAMEKENYENEDRKIGIKWEKSQFNKLRTDFADVFYKDLI